MYGSRQQDDNSPIKIGSIFAAALFKAAKNAENVALSMFSDNAELVRLNPKDTVMTMYQKIMAKVYGGGTNLQAALDQKSKLGFEPDTVIVLSDMEVNGLTGNRWNRTPTNVAKLFDKDAVLVAINLNSSETTPLDPRDGWIQLAGWSEAIFRFVDYTRRGDSIAMKLFNGELVD
jgi:Mg-chelatase subunit ChlD